MPLSEESIRICQEAIIEASEAILDVYQKGFETIVKSDGSPVTIADQKSSEILLRHLKKISKNLISEEAPLPPYSIRKHWSEFWLIDPLDGTKEFVHRNDEFCINLGFIKNGNPFFGMLAIPAYGLCVYGGIENPVRIWDYACDPKAKNTKTISPKFQDHCLRIIGSRSVKQNHDAFEKAMRPYYEKITYHFRGSAVKFLDMALSDVDVYPRKSPTMEWDTAAGHAILKGLGGDLTHWDNSPFVYGKENLLNPHFVAKTANFSRRIPSLPQDL